MKIQPIDYRETEGVRFETVKPVVKSRLKRLFERQFSSVLRSSVAEKSAADVPNFSKDGSNGAAEFEPSSVCLSKMVQSFIEENNEKQSVKCGGNRCNCFNRNPRDVSEDELESFDYFGDSYGSFNEACEALKGLVLCAGVRERNLLAHTSNIVEKNKICKRKDDLCRKVVIDGLLALGYDASICKSHWEVSPSFPAGEYEYIDVIIGGERLLIDIDLRSEFEVARSTKTYKAILQTLPYIFIGKLDRLQSIIGIVSEAAKQSLKKKGMPLPPWRKAEYVKAKWFSPYTRITSLIDNNPQQIGEPEGGGRVVTSVGDNKKDLEDEKAKVGIKWKPPKVKPKKTEVGVRIVAGLAAAIQGNP